MSLAPLAGDRLPTLPAERIDLRWVGRTDAPALLTVFGDPEVTRYWSSPPLPDLAAAEDLVREIHDLFRRRELFQWGIGLRPEGGLVGTATLWRLEAEHRRAEVGFALGRAHWGRGLASEALTTLVRFAFEELGLHRLEADVDPDNHASLRTLERQGFRREGLLRERYHMYGSTQDSVMLGLLRREWAGEAE